MQDFYHQQYLSICLLYCCQHRFEVCLKSVIRHPYLESATMILALIDCPTVRNGFPPSLKEGWGVSLGLLQRPVCRGHTR